MSEASARFALRARIAEALSRVLDTVAHREIGRRIGCAGTTVTARGSDLAAWPFSDLLTLAESDEILGNAVVANVRNEQTTQRQGEAIKLRDDEVRVLADHNAVDRELIGDLADSSPEHLRAILAKIETERQHEDELIADIRARLKVNP